MDLRYYLVLLPIMIPLTAAVVAILLRKRRRLQAGWALASMLLSLACSFWLLIGRVAKRSSHLSFKPAAGRRPLAFRW